MCMSVCVCVCARGIAFGTVFAAILALKDTPQAQRTLRKLRRQRKPHKLKRLFMRLQLHSKSSPHVRRLNVSALSHPQAHSMRHSPTPCCSLLVTRLQRRERLPFATSSSPVEASSPPSITESPAAASSATPHAAHTRGPFPDATSSSPSPLHTHDVFYVQPNVRRRRTPSMLEADVAFTRALADLGLHHGSAPLSPSSPSTPSTPSSPLSPSSPASRSPLPGVVCESNLGPAQTPLHSAQSVGAGTAPGAGTHTDEHSTDPGGDIGLEAVGANRSVGVGASAGASAGAGGDVAMRVDAQDSGDDSSAAHAALTSTAPNEEESWKLVGQSQVLTETEQAVIEGAAVRARSLAPKLVHCDPPPTPILHVG